VVGIAEGAEEEGQTDVGVSLEGGKGKSLQKQHGHLDYD